MHRLLLGYNFLTDEEKAELEQIEKQKALNIQEYNAKLMAFFDGRIQKPNAEPKTEEQAAKEVEEILNYARENTEKQAELTDRISKLVSIGTERYITYVNGNNDTVIADAKRVLNNITYVDIIRFSSALREGGKDALEVYDRNNFIHFLFIMTEEQRKACDKYGLYEAKYKIYELAEQRADALLETTPQTKEEMQELLKDIKPFSYADYLSEDIRPVEEKQKLYDALNRLTNISKPAAFSLMNSYVNNQIIGIWETLAKQKADGQLTFLPLKLDVDISGKASKMQVFNYVQLSYDGELSYNKAKITSYDKLILDTVCSIILAGNDQMTLTDIYKVSKGNTKTRPNQKALDRIELALRKFSGHRLYMDITNEINAQYINTDNEDLLKGTWDRPMLEYEGLELIAANGSRVKAIKINRKPMLLQYNEAKRQIVTFPTELLDTPEHFTESYAAIKSYLLKEITLMKKGHRNNYKILYSTIYSECGLEEPTDRTIKSRDRETIKKMLDYWKSHSYIKGYKDSKDGNKITGIEIEF